MGKGLKHVLMEDVDKFIKIWVKEQNYYFMLRVIKNDKSRKYAVLFTLFDINLASNKIVRYLAILDPVVIKDLQEIIDYLEDRGYKSVKGKEARTLLSKIDTLLGYILNSTPIEVRIKVEWDLSNFKKKEENEEGEEK